jgi:hypothetical protein
MTSFKTYLFSYRYKDAVWGFDLKAESPDDAQERLKALAWATYDGELVAIIPANSVTRPFIAPLLTMICGIRNFYQRGRP